MTNASITPVELFHLLQQPPTTVRELVIDIRSSRQFFRRHIPGSHHLSAAALVSGEFLDADLVLVADTEDSALQLRDTLHGAGFHRQIRYLQGGLDTWAEAGLSLQATPGAERSLIMGKDSLPFVVTVSLATLALAFQHAPFLLFSVTIGFVVAPLLLGLLTQRSGQSFRRHSA